jgi:hypothetical protein
VRPPQNPIIAEVFKIGLIFGCERGQPARKHPIMFTINGLQGKASWE